MIGKGRTRKRSLGIWVPGRKLLTDFTFFGIFTKKIGMTRFLLYICLLAAGFVRAQFVPDPPSLLNADSTSQLFSNTVGEAVNIDRISRSVEAYWKTRDPFQKGSGYKPFKRWEYFWKYLADTQGNLPSSENILESWKSKHNIAARTPNPTANWISVGPSNVGVYSGRLPGTGRLNAVAADPNNENVWYAGAPAGGIWKSTDAGQSWTNLFDDFLQIGVSGIAIDPNDSNTIYITTGDDDAADSYSVGVYKSTDGGQTWNPTGLTTSGVNTLMNEIVIDPSNSDIIWAATSAGLYKSLNAGTSWELLQSGYISDFKLKPGAPNTVYAVANRHIGGAGNATTFYKTTNGVEFARIESPVLPNSAGRVVLGVSPADPEVLYVLAANTSSQSFSYQGFYKSEDSGNNFVESPNTTNIMESSQAWFDLALEVSPTNANEVYMGCLNIWKSTNGGNIWFKLNEWYINDESYTHADIHTLKFYSGKLFAATDGGIYVSENGGSTFTDYTGEMSIGQFYKLSVSDQDPSKMIGGLQDNGGQVLNQGNWSNYHGGDGMDNAIDPNNDNILYGFSQFGGTLNISSDSGQSIGAVGPPRDEQNDRILGNWITPLAAGPAGEIYAGFDGVYRLSGNSWEKISTNDFGGIDPGDDYVKLEDLLADPVDPNVLYAAEGTFVYQSRDGGQTFQAFFNADYEIADLAIDTDDGSAVYVVTSLRVGIDQARQLTEVGARKVWKVPVNQNGDPGPGVDLTLDLPPDQAIFAVVHQGRHTDNPIYVGTNLGVYRLDDSRTEWEDYFAGLPSTAVSDLEISLDDELITASTYGRGVWQSPIPVQVPDTDIRLLSLTPANGAILCSDLAPQITVENNGLSTIENVTVIYSVNGESPESFEQAISLDSGESGIIALPNLGIGGKGEVRLNAHITVDGDSFSENNETEHLFYVNDTGVGNQLNNFEGPGTELLTYNEGNGASLWEKGVPSGSVLNEAASGTEVYGTNLEGNHPDGIRAYLISECYDFTTILAPVLRFQMAYDLEENFDIVYVQYSTDEGTTWNILGSVDSQPNWYSSSRTNDSSGEEDDCQNCPGSQWTGTNSVLTEYAYDFLANAARGEPDLSSETRVVFRIVFQADPLENKEGAVIDDFGVSGFEDDDDDDDDGVLDADDNCPLIPNPEQEDTDGDGQGDVCDTDDDNDGVLDTEDNCPLVPNPGQEDADNDGIGDVCDSDDDNDGVPNDSDTCPDTPSGTIVGLDGCPAFTLPATNFMVQIQGESCRSSDNGAITVEAVEPLNYLASLSGNGLDASRNFTDQVQFDNLGSGIYSLCIKVENQADYELCYTLEVPQPEDLSVSGKVGTLGKEITLELKGGKRYSINLNGTRYETSASQITLSLTQPVNQLEVRTDFDCQGVYTQTITLSEALIVLPNPIENGDLQVFIPGKERAEVQIRLFSLDGSSVLSKRLTVIGGVVRFNMDAFARGVYLLNVMLEDQMYSYKIIKR
jgi:photosystem II stability/assembly factor-like uncharacterized protein